MIAIVISLWPDSDESTSVQGDVRKPLNAGPAESADNEENAVRLAEQMVREAFSRLRKKLAKG